MEIKTDVSKSQDITIVTVSGSIQTPEANKTFVKVLAQTLERRHSCVIDLHKANWINSLGLSSLKTQFQLFQKAKLQIVISNPSGQAMNSLTIAKLDTLCRIFDTVDEAIVYLTGE